MSAPTSTFEHNGLTYTIRKQNILEQSTLYQHFILIADLVFKARGFAEGRATENRPLALEHLMLFFIQLFQVTTITGDGAYKFNLYTFSEKDLARFDKWFEDFTGDNELSDKWVTAYYEVNPKDDPLEDKKDEKPSAP